MSSKNLQSEDRIIGHMAQCEAQPNKPSDDEKNQHWTTHKKKDVDVDVKSNRVDETLISLDVKQKSEEVSSCTQSNRSNLFGPEDGRR